MSSTLYLVSALSVIAVTTLFTRALPFLLFGSRPLPAFARYLGAALPPAIMVILVCYCLRHISFRTFPGGLPDVLGCLIVAGVHLWKRNMYLSIIAGTIGYMLLIRLL